MVSRSLRLSSSSIPSVLGQPASPESDGAASLKGGGRASPPLDDESVMAMAEADQVTQHGSQTSSDAWQAATEMGIGKLVCKRHAFLQNTVATKIAASPWTDFWRIAAPSLAAFRHLRNVVFGVRCDSSQSRSCATSSGTAPDRNVVAVAGTGVGVRHVGQVRDALRGAG